MRWYTVFATAPPCGAISLAAISTSRSAGVLPVTLAIHASPLQDASITISRLRAGRDSLMLWARISALPASVRT